MKKTTLTEKKAENTPNGGVLVGKRKGQTIIHDEGTLSGYLVGKTHAEGGIKAVNKSTGQPLEMQGGEVVITAPAVSDQTKNQFNGQMLTNRQILSKINEKGGGVSFADGGDIPKSIKHSGEKYNYGGKTMTDYEILQMINKGGHLSKGKSLAQIAKMHNVTLKELQSQVNMGMKAESEHTSSKREQMKIVKDHLYENPKYYTLLKKAGLEYGGQIELKINERLKEIRNDEDFYPFEILNENGEKLGIIELMYRKDLDGYQISNSNVIEKGKGIGKKSYLKLRQLLGKPIYSDSLRSEDAENMWKSLEKANYANYNEDIGKYKIYKKGGSLVEESKKGDHPARDLNNYNDVLDVDADGVVGAETGLYADGGDIDFDVDGTGGADASSGVGAFEDGGDLDFLNDVDRIFDEGGSTDLPKVDYVTITSVGNRTLYSELVGEKYGNLDVLKSDLNKFFKEKNETPSYIYIQPNDSSNNFGISFKKGKNTVLNFNPLTGQNSDIIKQLDRRYPRSVKKYDWNDFYQNKNRPVDKQEPKKESSAPTSTSGNGSRQFSSGEINMFNQIDKIVKDYEIEFVDFMSWGKDSDTIDFDIVNTLTGEVYKLRKFNKSLGIQEEDDDRVKSTELIIDFNEWKKSNPTSASGEIPEVKYLVDRTNNAYISDIRGLKNYIDKLFSKGLSRVSLRIIMSNSVEKDTFFYIYFNSKPDASEKRHFNVLEDLDALKKAIFGTSENLEYYWDDFFKAESKEEEKEEQPVRNFELEKKYLTQRINALSSELDLKRPILSNDEVAFYQREINKFVSKLRKVSNDEMELKPIEARVNGVYKVKWGDYTKQYPETDVLSINGIKSELTFEEYMTVRTPEFKSFFGNWEQAYFDNTYSGVSKIINPKTKEPMPVFHGTNVLFTEWKTYETNNAHYFAVKREMSDFFATSWESRSDKAGVDSKAIKALNPNTGTFLYRCFLDVRNPIDFSKFGVEKRPIKEFLLFLKINYNIGDYDFWTNLGNAKGFTSETRVYAWQIIRLWQNFTKYVKTFTTYDGYIFYEYIPDTPFGGLENASLSFCAFESNQIKFADAYEFNALSNDSRFDFGGKL